jgi:dipeptidyl aminopeptidase/acylaminoacyl peptidase
LPERHDTYDDSFGSDEIFAQAHFRSIPMSTVRDLIVITIGTFVVTLWSSEATAKPLELATYLDFEYVSDPQISPDGSQVIYTRRYVDKINDRFSADLWVVGSDGRKNRALLEGSSMRWAPDGTRIAYLAKGDDDKSQIFVRWMDTEGAVTQVTHEQLTPKGLQWSPDGKSIAFIGRVPHESEWTVRLPDRPQGAKWTDDPVVVDTLHYRQDRVGFTNDGFDHLFVVPADGGTPRQITRGKWHVGSRLLGSLASKPHIDWSPDGRFITFDALDAESLETKFLESHIYIVNLANGEMSRITHGNGNYTAPAFSPDGTMLAFAGVNDAWSRFYPVPEIWVANTDGSNLRRIAADLADGPQQLTWSQDGRTVFLTMDDRGSRNLYAADLTGRVRSITDAGHVLTLGSISKNGIAAAVRSDSLHPPEVVLFPINNGRKMTQLTAVNEDILADVELAPVEEINFGSTEGANIQGWVVKPPGFAAARKYPLILQIHGGPSNMYNVGFNFSFQEYAANGYVVLYTNPRGSSGYGSEFANAVQNEFPGDRDYADLMAGVDAVIQQGYVDENRMFVTGCSAGGILTNWIVGQTSRFAAAVARCTVVNWIGFAGTTDVSGWASRAFDTPFWQDPSAWMEHSPLMHVGQVKTPTLLITGDRDLRTPLGEAEQYFAALKVLGIPTKLIPMRGEYHGTESIPSNFLRTQLYTRKWFEEHSPASEN